MKFIFPEIEPCKIALVLILLLVIIGVADAGTALTFQQPEDFANRITCSGGSSCTWSENLTGGNSVMAVSGHTEAVDGVPMTYAAATVYEGGAFAGIFLYDSTKTVMLGGTELSYGAITNTTTGHRIEVKIIGGSAYVYNDGVETDHSVPISQNPSYVGFHVNRMDNVIWGSDESKYIFGVPDQGYWTGRHYFIMKDILNPAVSGFYRSNTTDPNGTPLLMSSYYLPISYGKGTADNETIVLNEYGGGNYLTEYTGSRMTDAIQMNLTQLFESTAPYGLYVVTIPGTVEYSDTIPYVGSGAYIAFDKSDYGIGQSANVNVEISDSYYDIAVYSYKVVIQDIYGTEVSDQPITMTSASPHTGSVSYTFGDDDGAGVYYGLIYAVRRSDNEELLMNYDTCELTNTVIINGFVKDAETTNAITGATVNITQSSTTDSDSSGIDGNYSSSSDFIKDVPTTIFVRKAGYENYSHTFTPLYAGSFMINLTLMPNLPTFSNIALGGIVRVPPYNRTVDSATVEIKNGTTTYTATTNSAGYYIKNDMINNLVWDIWGSKTGYTNSTIYRLLVTGT